MRYLICTLLAACLFSVDAYAARTEIVVQPHLEAQLIAEYEVIEAGQTLSVAVKLLPDPGWHTYWMNPGDSGLATVIEWRLPAGVVASDIHWPVASKYIIGPLANYGFEGPTYLVSELTIPADFSDDTLSIEARADWLVCEDWCIPGTAEFKLDIPMGTKTLAMENEDSFIAARANLPKAVDWKGQYDIQDRQVTLLVEHPDAASMALSDSFYAFVGAGELVEHFESGNIQVVDDLLIIRRSLNTYFSHSPDAFPLLLVTDEKALQLWVLASPENAFSHRQTPHKQTPNLWIMASFAFLGGVLLNLMPCVFPVLSLKALSLTQHADQRGKDALWYTLGVLVTFVFFASLLLILRATGQALGWGFQLQNPWFIGFLVGLFVAIGLNLSGVFQVGAHLMRLGHSESADSGGAKGSFLTGLLAVMIASPCTAPFMGVALGFAMTQSPLVTLSIFAALGLGMASPLVALSYLPGIHRWLPKPGVWMDTFKQWMAIPIYLTSVWLIWVFGRQTGIDSAAILLIGLVFFATALWWYGKSQCKSARQMRDQVIIAVLLILGLASLPVAIQLQNDTKQGAQESQNWQPWSQEALASLKSSNPVFVNMTADWCITCLANERVALEISSTRALFAEHNIQYLKGDWTLGDEDITTYLAEYQRNGVPLYVLYWPGQEPQVLPQILTHGIILEAVQVAADKR